MQERDFSNIICSSDACSQHEDVGTWRQTPEPDQLDVEWLFVLPMNRLVWRLGVGAGACVIRNSLGERKVQSKAPPLLS